jgi:GNAT superfamily N-acetyltransferase
MPTTIRLAVQSDIPTLEQLIAASARTLSHGYYSQRQIEAAIRYVFGVDSQLISDGTYYVAVEDDLIVGCGGWSWRRTLYGGDQRPMGAGAVLNPTVDAARIRAFFVAGTHARHGVGSRILGVSIDAARAIGFSRLELVSTLPGIPFYRKFGFREVQPVLDTLPDGTALEFVLMVGTVDVNPSADSGQSQ